MSISVNNRTANHQLSTLLINWVVYRDIDFQLGLEMPSLIEFSKGPSVRSPHYLSSIKEQAYPLDRDRQDAPPEYDDVEAQPTSLKFSLKCPRHGETDSVSTHSLGSCRLPQGIDTVRFMKSLTGWKLKYMG